MPPPPARAASSSARGLSIVEALIAVALVASATAALLPVLAQAARLHRESDLQTRAALIAASRLERLTIAAGGLAHGGELVTPREGWHAWLDGEGHVVDRAAASFLCVWRVVPVATVAADIVTVRVTPLGFEASAVTLSTAVRRE